MTTASAIDVEDRLARVRAAKRGDRWDEIIELARDVEPVDARSDEIADAACFALSQRRRRVEALALLERLIARAATPMRLSSKAYVLYDALLSDDGLPGVARAELERRFLAAIDDHIRADEHPVIPLYRRGMFFAEVCAARDKKALADFRAAIAIWEGMSDADRARRHALQKSYVKSLYAGARSALRLHEAELARSLAARCLRVDETHDFVAPMFKLYQAAEACAGCGDLARAERGLRMALDAPGPRDRVFLHGALADVVAKADRVDDAISWLEAVRAERRPPWIWRKLGQLQLRAGRHDLAVQALEAALHRDRHGRHLTLIALGWAHLARGAPGPAKAAFLEALKVRKKRDQIVDDRARTGLREALHARGEPDGDDDINALLGRALADADLPRAAGPGREQARRVAGGRR